MNERYPIAKMLDGGGIGIVRSLGTHFSTIEFDEGGHHWQIIVENDEFDIIGYIGIGRRTIYEE